MTLTLTERLRGSSSMDIAKTAIADYLSALASSSPAPGGGSSAALSGAMAASLVSMVANLTAGRAKYADSQELVNETLAATAKLIPELTECIHKDMTAFDGVMAALRMPKDSDAQKAERSQALQDAYKIATSAPVETADKCLAVMKLAEGLLHRSNVTAACDLTAAAIEARAGILIALENVYVNLSAIHDSGYVAAMRERAANIDAESQRLLGAVREGVAEMTGGK